MAKAKVTDEEVIELGYKLQKAKKNVNGHALSKVLGGRPDRLQEVWEKHLLEMNIEDNELQDIMLTPELNEIFDSISNDLLVNVKQLLANCEQAMLARTGKQIEIERVANAERISALKEQLEDVLDTLTDREENVLRLRFGLDVGRTRTLEEVGKVFGVTRERIRQIEAKALRKLRHPSRSKRLKDFLE